MPNELSNYSQIKSNNFPVPVLQFHTTNLLSPKLFWAILIGIYVLQTTNELYVCGQPELIKIILWQENQLRNVIKHPVDGCRFSQECQ
jgi:hypothetical protein